eukprot:CAMPEP_0182855900 /NCGR_PEP_ID=MMETSP0034_2-20130328/2121_1 /TAXON_ID=156128 /ORGANISM="Nephroselmis pyriformis, Strain CCMP717" /LENGTH=109 /DNA_ID=CAMNT_0024986927 /DNA_START=100 /DNA_END=425 /DNA_ORIENTATION=+
MEGASKLDLGSHEFSASPYPLHFVKYMVFPFTALDPRMHSTVKTSGSLPLPLPLPFAPAARLAGCAAAARLAGRLSLWSAGAALSLLFGLASAAAAPPLATLRGRMMSS